MRECGGVRCCGALHACSVLTTPLLLSPCSCHCTTLCCCTVLCGVVLCRLHATTLSSRSFPPLYSTLSLSLSSLFLSLSCAFDRPFRVCRSTSNPTPNFQVRADSEAGLLFKNKRDRKVINVDPNAECGDNSTRHVVKTREYIQVVIYDHMTRRKS
jgi:hypothetical protein